MSSPHQPSGPPIPSSWGCLFPLVGAVLAAVAVVWWQYDGSSERGFVDQFTRTPFVVVWLALWVWLGATVGFVVGVIVAKCVSGRSATRGG
jgi:hypothetical protein